MQRCLEINVPSAINDFCLTVYLNMTQYAKWLTTTAHKIAFCQILFILSFIMRNSENTHRHSCTCICYYYKNKTNLFTYSIWPKIYICGKSSSVHASNKTKYVLQKIFDYKIKMLVSHYWIKFCNIIWNIFTFLTMHIPQLHV